MMVAIDDCTIENGCLQLVLNDIHAKIILPQEKDGSIKKEEKYINQNATDDNS